MVVRTEEQPGQLIDLDACPFLGHLQVTASEPRFDVREWDRRLGRCTGSGERRVRVAVYEHEVRPLTTYDLGDAGLHDVRIGSPRVEPVPRLVKPELLDEHVRQLPVVVLPRMDDDLVDAGDQEGEGERPALDELRAVPDDGEDLHSDGRLLARVGGPVCAAPAPDLRLALAHQHAAVDVERRPVANPASSESRNATSAATSSERPRRPTGIVFSIASIRSSATEATIGPSIAAGATAFTVTPWAASSVAA